MKKTRIALVLLVGIMLVSGLACGNGNGEPAPNGGTDVAEIEGVMEDYFAAFNAYDVDSVLSFFSQETLANEEFEIRLSVEFAEDLNMQFDLTDIVVTVNGDNAEAFCTIDVGSEIYNLVRENGNWKISSKEAVE